MRVFVTGGTGFVGQEILTSLVREGDEPVALARRLPSAPVPGIRYFQGDLTSPERLAEGMRGTGAVIHLVGIISEVGQSTFENVHTRGTRTVLAAARQAGVRRFVHMSALGTRPAAISRYHQTKWAAEEAVRVSGFDYTIFRPSLIFGPADHFVNLFARIMRFSPFVPAMGRPTARFQPVHVQDVAEAFVRSLRMPESVGRNFDLCGPDILTLPEILRFIMQASGRKRFILRVPSLVARAQATLLEAVFPFVGKAPPLNRDQLAMLNEDNIGDASLARELLDLKPRRFLPGIEAYLRSPAPSV